MEANHHREPRLVPPVFADDHVVAGKDGAVTLVEYGDYECPQCAQAAPIIRDVLKVMGPHLTFVFRHFPLASVHPRAEVAAQASEAAGRQGRFWEMHHAMFADASSLTENGLVKHARDLGLNVRRFRDELAADIHAGRVQRDVESGIASGVGGTPTFFIDGWRYNGPWGLMRLLEALERAVKERNGKESV
jgi:protein-disulfide isomerase